MNIEKILFAIRKRILFFFYGRYFVRRRGQNFFLIDIMNHIDRRIEKFGGYEKQSTEALIDLIHVLGADLFLDVGANLGWYTISVRTKFPSIEIIAFEPDSRNRYQLAANLFLNDMQDSIQVLPVALSDNDGVERFSRFSDQNRGRSGISPEGDFEVKCQTIDKLFEGVRDRVVAIKIDVEGHETEVLAGGEKFLRQNICLLQVECFEMKILEERLSTLDFKKIMHIGHDAIFSNSSQLRDAE